MDRFPHALPSIWYLPFKNGDKVLSGGFPICGGNETLRYGLYQGLVFRGAVVEQKKSSSTDDVITECEQHFATNESNLTVRAEERLQLGQLSEMESNLSLQLVWDSNVIAQIRYANFVSVISSQGE